MSNFRIRLKELREQRRMNQTDLGRALGLSTGAVGNYERGERTPDIETLERIADYFNVSIDYLRGRDDVTIRIVDPSAREEFLLQAYRELNEEGRKRLDDYVGELLKIYKEV